jgi:hypothetical protein
MIYIFFRADDGWYPITLADDADAIRNAEYNPGTVKVENLNGDIIWQAPKIN